MKRFSLIAATAALAVSTQLSAQVSVFGDPNFDQSVTQTEIDNAGPVFSQQTVLFPSTQTFLFNGTSQKEINATKRITIQPGFKSGTYSGTGYMKLSIVKSPFDVKVMNYNDLSEVRRNDKIEFGFILPDDIQTKVDNFVTDANVSPTLKLNPFLEWKLRIVAEFTNEVNETVSLVDAFYFRNFVRNEDTDYWDDLGTTEPFRIRFSPIFNGKWNCVIKVYVNNTLTLVTPSFQFNVVQSVVPGFVTIAPNGTNLKRDANSDVIYPVGTNLPFPAGGESGLVDYQGGPMFLQDYKMHYLKDYLDNVQAFADQGGKYIRYIVSQPNSEIEFEELGNYYDRLMFATEIDNLLYVAHQEGMLIHFNLMLHSSIMQMADYNHYGWDFGSNHDMFPASQYCYATAFNTQLPSDMILDETTLVDGHPALDYLKQRYRYYISRYGFSTDIELFELLSEPWHMNADIDSEGSYEPATESDAADGDIARLAITTFHSELSTYIREHLGHYQHLMAVVGRMPVSTTYGIEMKDTYTAFTNVNETSWSLPYIDVATISNYSAYPNRLMNSKANDNSIYASADIDNNLFLEGDKTYAYAAQKIRQAYNIPTMIAETGTGDGTQECSTYKIHPFDVTRLGFCGLAGFNMWDGFTYFDPTSSSPNENAPVHFWPSVINTWNHMNGAHLNEILSSSWTHGSELQDMGLINPLNNIIEQQYYISGDKTKAAGYVANKSYNIFTKRTNNLGQCYRYGNEISEDEGDIYEANDFDEDFWELHDLSSSNWIGYHPIEIQGLKPNTDYLIHWFSYIDGYYMSSECFNTSNAGKHDVSFPVLYVENGSISPSTPLSPVLWYTVEEFNCNNKPARVAELKNKVAAETLVPEELNLINSHFSLSPNPFNEELTVYFDEGIQSILVLDNLGKPVSTFVFSGEIRVNLILDQLAKGIYYLVVNNSNERHVIVKQ